MIADFDIWQSANLLIEQYGKDAAFMAAWSADAMLDKGNVNACRLWRRIFNAIEELERTERKTAEALN